MIADTPRVKISGITYPIYAIDYSWGGADAPSKVVIDFINKNGEYKEPVLSATKVSQIEMGNFFSFEGHPVSFSHKFSNGGKIMSVTYWDKSVILDKVFVGLKGMHGAAPKAIGPVKADGTTAYGTFNDPSHFVLVGNYVDPCEGVLPTYLDPCSPCITQTEYISTQEDTANKFIDCEKARFTQLLDVTYTFEELRTALASKGIILNTANAPNLKKNFSPQSSSTIYARYTGTAREVLKSWANDLGLTFFWQNNSVVFLDLKVGITINDSNFYSSCSLIDYSTSESIEDNIATGNILYFGAEGELRPYNCSNNSFQLSLIPVTLKDIFSLENGSLNPYIAKYYTTSSSSNISGLQIATLFSKYSRMMRDMVLLYEYYDVDVVNDVEPDTDFPLLGMKIKSTWDVSGEIDSESPQADELQKIFWNYIPESIRKRASYMGASMAVIEWNPVWHDKFYEFEKTLADDFLGQYWISFFSKGDTFTYSAPDGNPDYYDAGSPVALPFLKIIPKSIISTSPYLDRIINSSAAKNKSSGHVGDVETNNPNSYAHSFILMQREPAWEPAETNEDIRKFENNYKDLYFYATEPFKHEGYGDDLPANQFFALIFDKPDTFDLVDAGEVSHPIERNNTNLITELNDNPTRYGLRSDQCQSYQLQLDVNGNTENPSWHHAMDFFMPVQSHDEYGVNFPGYFVIASQNSARESQTNTFVRRMEVINGDVPLQSDDSIGISINFKDLTSRIQNILEQTVSGCQYNLDSIKEFISEFKIASARPKQVRRRSHSYNISGFPTRKLQVQDGLASLSIRYDTESGISSSIEFSNSPPITISDNIVEQEVQNHILKRLLGRKSLSSNNKVLV